VTPDAYVVARDGLTLRSERVARKERMTVAVTGGTREIAVPPPMQRQPSVSHEQVRAAARLALAVESELGWPADVECAWARGELYLLQARPITTLETKQETR
jgi:pyruvate,water dikinase